MVTQQSGWHWNLNHDQGDTQLVQTLSLPVCSPYNPDTECRYHVLQMGKLRFCQLMPLVPRVMAREKWARTSTQASFSGADKCPICWDLIRENSSQGFEIGGGRVAGNSRRHRELQNPIPGLEMPGKQMTSQGLDICEVSSVDSPLRPYAPPCLLLVWFSYSVMEKCVNSV